MIRCQVPALVRLLRNNLLDGSGFCTGMPDAAEHGLKRVLRDAVRHEAHAGVALDLVAEQCKEAFDLDLRIKDELVCQARNHFSRKRSSMTRGSLSRSGMLRAKYALLSVKLVYKRDHSCCRPSYGSGRVRDEEELAINLDQVVAGGGDEDIRWLTVSQNNSSRSRAVQVLTGWTPTTRWMRLPSRPMPVIWKTKACVASAAPTARPSASAAASALLACSAPFLFFGGLVTLAGKSISRAGEHASPRHSNFPPTCRMSGVGAHLRAGTRGGGGALADGATCHCGSAL
mmetsp:Transcript_26561/g.85841  ORF Transcript_26561/g.85841 Transcript_26561/m.85841 type:complete len:287 (+) Transcript_26561:133-993(+)